MCNKMRQGRRLVVVVVQARFYRQSGPARVLWSLENINVGISVAPVPATQLSGTRCYRRLFPVVENNITARCAREKITFITRDDIRLAALC